jgi:hypothetical protein
LLHITLFISFKYCTIISIPLVDIANRAWATPTVGYISDV